MDILPKISIIVPVYNVEQYLSKCLESIINQTYKNLEIIIINDGSTDKSGVICDYYSEIDNRIILTHQQNQGLSMARNNAIDIANGDYFGFVDSDDWIKEDMYEILYKNSITYNADISVCDSIKVVDLDKIDIKYDNDDETITIYKGIDKIKYNIYQGNNVVWNKLYKRDLFKDIRFPKGKFFEDIFVMYKLIDNAKKIVTTSKQKYYYLLRQDSITLSPFTIKHMDNVIEAYITKYEYISNKYPEFEIESRTLIFSALIDGMYKAYKEKCIETDKNELVRIINLIKNYDINDCSLSEEKKNILKLLFEDINNYIVGIRIYDLSQSHQRDKNRNTQLK